MLGHGLQQLVQVFNSWVKDVDLEFHGFSVVDITPARAQMDNWVIRSTASPAFAADPRTDPNAVCVRRNSVQTVSGTQRITAAGSELGPR
jgi:alkaline phosphatase D